MKEVWIAFVDLFVRKKNKSIKIVTIFFLSLVGALLEGVSFTFIFLSLGFLSDRHLATELPVFTLPFFSFLSQSFDKEQLFVLSIVAAVIIQVVKSGFNLLSQVFLTDINAELQINLQDKIYNRIMELSFSCISQYKTGDLVEYVRTPFGVIHLILTHMSNSAVAVLNILALTGIMYLFSPTLTILVMLIFGGLGVMQKYIVKKLAKHSHSLSECFAAFSMDTVQTLYGLRAIFTFDRQKEMLNKTSKLLHRIAKVNRTMTLLTNSIPFINEISGISLVGIFLILGHWLGGESGNLPILLTFVTIAYRLNGKIQQLISSVGQIAYLWGYGARIEDILNTEGKDFSSNEGENFKEFEKDIQLQDVSLVYPGQKMAALRDLNLTIPKGRVTALVGLSGAGKSSILDLLLRLYSPTAGTITIDQIPISAYNLSSWRRVFAVVSQDVFIFNETIEENIRFGQENASLSDVVRCAELAGADEFISKMPLRYQTVVGERGYRLSGGERQRLSLARALLRDSQILVLDEATSNLDSKSEVLIKKALLEVQKQKTVIIVAHRLSTIMHADKIVVLESGQVKEEGTHLELLEKKGLYASLWALQSQDFGSSVFYLSKANV